MTTITINGTELFYRETGNGSSPILLIHGTAANADIWGETFDALVAHHRVIAYDRRGFSRSVYPPVKDLHLHSEDAAALLTQMHAAPATVVGWSAGGIIALDLAVNHPELVSSLVLCEPPLHARKHPQLSFVKDFLKVQMYRWMKRERQANEVFLRFALAYNSRGTVFDRLPVTWQQAMLDNFAATLSEIDAGTGEYLSEAQISSINCPVACLVGALSLPFYRDATRRIMQLLPQAKLQRVDGAGHFVPFDQPGEFVRLVREVTTASYDNPYVLP
jgi:pimeloyl-ACP methyl ester carboxylesterase